MLATKDFVFIHVPKTGGEFIGGAIKRTCEVQEAGKHVPFRETPERFRDLPAICFVRNPWDWYVSWWHWARAHEGEQRDFPALLRHCFEEPKDHYTRVFEAMAHDPEDDQRDRLMHQARFENLREDFVAFLDRHQIATRPCEKRSSPARRRTHRGAVGTTAPTTTTKRGSWSARR